MSKKQIRPVRAKATSASTLKGASNGLIPELSLTKNKSPEATENSVVESTISKKNAKSNTHLENILTMLRNEEKTEDFYGILASLCSCSYRFMLCTYVKYSFLRF